VTTYTIFALATNGGWIESQDTGASLAAVKAGTGSFLNANTSGDTGFLYFDSTPAAGQFFLDFVTSSVADIVQSATLSLNAADRQGANTDAPVYQARLYDFGTSLTTADWRTPTTFAACTLLAHHNWSDVVRNAYNDFTSDAGFPASINQSGSTRIVINNALFAANGTPTDTAYVELYLPFRTGTSQDPKLVIVTAPPYRPGGTKVVRRTYLRR
jgi:hypothetical protein